jgi:hypothetical protein
MLVPPAAPHVNCWFGFRTAPGFADQKWVRCAFCGQRWIVSGEALGGGGMRPTGIGKETAEVRRKEVFRDDDVQGAPDRFFLRVTKEFGRGAVPDLNHALSICEDDPIRGLLDDESEQVKALRAGQHRASLRYRSDA